MGLVLPSSDLNNALFVGYLQSKYELLARASLTTHWYMAGTNNHILGPTGYCEIRDPWNLVLNTGHLKRSTGLAPSSFYKDLNLIAATAHSNVLFLVCWFVAKVY